MLFTFMKLYRCLVVAAVVLLFSITANARPDKPLVFSLLSHHEYAPLIVDKNTGLSADLAKYLSVKSEGKYHFQFQYLPKNRLLRTINQANFKGLVPWIIPAWINVGKSTRFQWSTSLIETGDRVLSLAATPIEWRGVGSLYGKRFGGVIGHVYVDLALDIESGKIQREDAPSVSSNLNKLRAKRVDAIFFSQLAIDYLKHQDPNHFRDIYISKAWRFERKYALQAMYDLGSPSANLWLKETLQRLNSDPEWHKILDTYGIH